MIILDRPRVFDRLTLSIPMNSGHAIISPSTQVELSFVPMRFSEAPHSELLLSPIERENWYDLWRIAVTFVEGPGVVHQLYECLASVGVRVVAAETSVTDHHRLHTVELLIDATKYKGYPRDEDSRNRSKKGMETLEDLTDYLTAEILPKFDVNEFSRRPRLRIRRVRELLNEKESLKRVAEHANTTTYPVDVKKDRNVGIMNIVIPERVLSALLEELDLNRDTSKPLAPCYVCISDTKDRCLRALFFRDSSRLVHVQFRTAYRIGTLSTITGILSGARFNIITSSRRTEVYERTGLAEFLLEADEAMANPREELTALINDAVSRIPADDLTIKDFRFFDIATSHFPKWKVDSEQITPTDHHTKLDFIMPRHSDIAEKFENQYLRMSREPNVLPTRREEILEKIARDGAKLAKFRNCPHRIFVSHSLNTGTLIPILRRIEEEKEFKGRVQLIAAPSGDPLAEYNVEMAISSMIEEKCNGLLGIWSYRDDDAITISSGKIWPSPWLHFELGVALAFGLEHRLLIQKCIDRRAWSKIENDKRHGEYAEREELEDSIKKELRILMGLINRRPHSSSTARVLQ